MSVEGSKDNEEISYLKQRVADLEKCLFKSEEKFRSVADSAPVGLFLDNTEEGFTAGIGLNYSFTPDFAVRVDYAYQNFGVLDYSQHYSIGIKF